MMGLFREKKTLAASSSQAKSFTKDKDSFKRVGFGNSSTRFRILLRDLNGGVRFCDGVSNLNPLLQHKEKKSFMT